MCQVVLQVVVRAELVIVHRRAYDVIPIADSGELVRNSGGRLIEVGTDWRKG